MTLTPTKYTAATRLLIFIAIFAFAINIVNAKLYPYANKTVVLDMPGGFPLITDGNQFFSPYIDPELTKEEFIMGNKLIDNNILTYWASTDAKGLDWKNIQYLCIDLRKNVKDKDLVFQLAFCRESTSKEKMNPIAAALYYSTDGENWIFHKNYDLNYHGSVTGGSFEDSDKGSIRQFGFKINADAKYIKVEFDKPRGATGTEYQGRVDDNRKFALAEFQIYETLGKGYASALLQSGSQMWGFNASDNAVSGNYNNLLDNKTVNPDDQTFLDKDGNYKDIPTFWQSSYYNGTNEHYLHVNLHGRIHKDEQLQLIIRRRKTPTKDKVIEAGYNDAYKANTFHPTKIRVEASDDNKTFTTVANLTFDYPSDGSNDGLWQGSELFNIGNEIKTAKYLRFYCEESFETATGKYAKSRMSFDEFRLYITNRDDLIREFTPNNLVYTDVKNLEKQDAQFMHRYGIIDRENHWSELLYNYSDWGKWENGKWKEDEDEDAELLRKHNIQMPDYSYITGTDNIEGHTIDLDGERQRAHTLYHIIYALPEKHLNLTSFSGFKDIKGDYYYMENYIRWYDYKTDKKSENLRFPVGNEDDKMINIAGAGHFAGKEFGLNRSIGTVATYCVPKGGIKEDEWIAVDYAQNSSMATGRNYDSENNIYYEPRIAFRHLFHIVDGTQFADENMASHEKNIKYAKANRRHVTARAGKDFQIRFDNLTAADGATFSALPYIKGGGYDYVRAPKIKVYDENGITEKTDIKFGYKGDYTEHGFTIDGNIYPESKYHRALYCDANNAKKGKYLVRVVGCDENGNEIKVDGYNLILQEYLINFVSENEASYAQTNDIPKFHKQSYLQSQYSNPIAQVNFDNYRFLLEAKHKENYLINTLYSEHHERLYPDGDYSNAKEGDYRLKWPLPWNQSNYSYMYGSGFDFNMYTITNTFQLVPFNDAARDKNDIGLPEYESFQDRMSIDNQGSSRGFMYYVNASQDPGEMVQIPVENLCPGSTLHVSGWVNEMSGNALKHPETPEMANLIVSMQRIDKEGKERTLHSFVTGYQEVGTYGNWHHFYYSVVLNYDEFDLSIDPDATFRIILENNSLSSHGADYAVDDIRVWVAQPNFKAKQMIPLCNGTSATTVQVTVPFEVMLASIDKSEAESIETNETYKFFYTFLRKDVYDKTYNETHDYETAFDAALMHYAYMDEVKDDEGNTDEDQTYGWVNFDTFYTKNPEAKGDGNDQPGSESSMAYRCMMNDGKDRALVFNTDPRGGEMKPGDWLIIAVQPATKYPQIVDEVTGRTEDFKLCNVFDLETKCAIRKDFLLSSSAIIRVNGEVQDPDGITVCVNQAPVITLDVNDEQGEHLGYTQPFDWFEGPMSDRIVNDVEIKGYTSMEKNGMSLHDVMYWFRQEYKNVTSLDTVTATTKFTQPMIDWLKELTAPDPVTKRPKVYINKVSFTFPTTTVPEGYESSLLYVTGIPINRYEGGDKVVCVEPTEVRLEVKNHAPEMLHGFHESTINGTLEYPDWMIDVPLRIGLDQIEKISYPNVDAATSGNSLQLPLRLVTTVSKKADEMVVPYSEGLDDYLYLAETDDYEIMEGNELVDNKLIILGRVVKMEAKSGGKDNYIKVIFDKQFTFKEGCYYKVRFNYEENVKDKDDNDKEVYCNGQHLLTLKVVPKYVKWTGEVNRNWANDENWRRVTSTDLKLPTDATGKLDADAAKNFNKYITDGSANKTVKSYAPLNFTHVIIENKDGKESEENNVPAIYAFDTTQMCSINYNETTYPVIDAPEDATAGEGTEGINYEMAATEVGSNLSCRPWYTHTADKLYFGPRTTITGQGELTYNRAWADFELDHSEWRLCSSPFQETVAGDFYLPTKNARQDTQLFEEINFNKAVNNRFNPAVFQRAWNHNGSANIYKLNPNDNTVSVEDAAGTEAVRFEWSNVYNDVKEDYAKGNGYAIKADIAKVTNKPEEVLFRLPKSDTKYFYYNYEDPNNETLGSNDITRSANNYKLNPEEGSITVEGRDKSIYFMVGNPFMAYIDVKEIISQYNASNPAVKLAKKYYFIDSNGAHHVFWGDEELGTETEVSNKKTDVASMNDGLVPPFTAFFLETEEPTKKIVVPYNYSMAVDEEDAYAPELLETRGGGTQSIKIEAYRNGEYLTDAVLRYMPNASEEYVASEDMALIYDKDLVGDHLHVYTASGKMATAINSVPDGTTVRLGLIAPDNGETIIKFAGNIESGLYLYDAYTDTKDEIEPGTSIKVEGSTSNRYFITHEMLNDDINTISIVARRNQVSVTAPGEGEMMVNVYDMVGRRIYSYSTAEYDHSFELDNGIFVVDVRRDGKRHSEKIIIK